MPASKECPLCGGTMKIKATTNSHAGAGQSECHHSDHNGMGLP